MTSRVGDPPTDTVPLDLRRPFTRADAIAAGIDPRLLRGSKFRRIFNGVYISAQVPINPFVRAQAALVVHPPTAFASHLSAARVYDLPVPRHSDEHVSVFDESERRRRAGIVCHVAPGDSQVARHRNIRVSMPTQMFVELASILSLVDLVVVGDALARREWVTPQQLVDVSRESTSKHADAARRAAAYVRTEVDSPMETKLRMLIVLAGLPEPEVNHKVRDESGRVIMRFDLSYPDLKLVIEYDGKQHEEDGYQRDRDVERREQLDDIRWRIVVVTSKQFHRAPAATLARIRKALVERGARGLPPRLSDDWRPHFSVYSKVGR